MMKTRFRGGLPVLALLLGVALLACPVVYAQAPAEQVTGDQLVKIGVNNVEEKIDCLISFVQDPQHMSAQDIVTVPDNFKFDSGLMAQVETEVGPEGYIVTQADEAGPKVDAIIRSALEAIQQSVSLEDQRIVQALLDNLDNLPDDYCELTDMEAYEEPGERELAAEGEIDDGGGGDHQPDPYPEPEGNWIYYGKAYNVPDDVYDMDNGVLSLTEPFHMDEDSYPPAIAPLLLFTGDGWPGDMFESPSVSSAESGSFYRYAYNTQENATTGPFSATLYMNENSEESDWIAFSYGDVDLPEGYEAFVGLIPGDGSENHPGPGEPRNMEDGWLDLSDEAGVSHPPDDGKYWWLCEVFDYSDFDLADSFLVFRPDEHNKYTVTFGTRDMVVDSLGLDGNPTILDTAVENVRDPDLLDTVDDGYFKPGEFGYGGYWLGYGDDAEYEYWDGEYEYGLQTVGSADGGYGGFNYEPKCFTNEDTLDRINSNGLLAYAVQLEEDVVNKKILEMYHDAVEGTLKQDVADALASKEIRDRDAFFVKQADAMSGRVTKDHNGDWVRAQQYVLRPNDMSVQVVNVCLRSGSELSTMLFTTNFRASYDGDLTELPWNGWLGTDNWDGKRLVWTTELADLLDMNVQFTNPANESLAESRTFDLRKQVPGGCGLYYHKILGETLTINETWSYGFTTEVPGDEQYRVNNDDDTDGFSYELGPNGDLGSRNIDVSFYVAEDGDMGLNTEAAKEYGDDDIDDIWDALRVNLAAPGAPFIGAANLEIAISNGENADFFNEPIDVIYIPMSRMLWKGEQPT